jgi:hypothetical protein
MLALLLTLTLPSFASIGLVSDTKGPACSIERNKSKLPGDKGASIESMDTYSTGNCVSNIVFKDDTKVKITENSRLVIDDFVFDPKKSDASKLVLKVGMGTVRYASGQISKTNPQQASIRTPTATIVVRGTDFTMTVDETGQSLIVLLPSCKDDKDIKQYELQENTCRVGSIEVETDAGAVILNQAFHATYITSSNVSPTAPTVINIVESKINNTLLLLQPMEIQRALRERTKSKRDSELEEEEQFLSKKIQERIESERAKLLVNELKDDNNECDAKISICVRWESDGAPSIQSRGKGTAFRMNEENQAEIKTEGYISNTFITVLHNDIVASYLIGDGSPGGNSVHIRQNNGVLRKNERARIKKYVPTVVTG